MLGQYAPANDSQIFSYRNLFKRYMECRKNKRNTINALRFEFNAEQNLFKLERELKNKSYRPSRSILFAATSPKVREIFAADFSDRIVHHVLVKELEKIWEPKFIFDSYSCREDKGTHHATVRLRKFLRQITRNGNVRAYYLQLDIKDFFTSINKGILFNILAKKIDNPDLLWLVEVVLFWDCTTSYVVRGKREMLKGIPENKSLFGKNNERGLPIGNLTSQFFANVYLNELDQFVKHELKAHYYIRYVDDFVILSHDPNELSMFKRKIDTFVNELLALKIHPVRQKLRPVSDGIDFLGYIIRHNYVLVRRRVVNSFKEKIRQFNKLKKKDFAKFKATCASYYGHFKWANCYRLIKNFGFN